VVVEAPEMGDEIQAIKAGLLEVADIIVVNKAIGRGASNGGTAARDALRRRSTRGAAGTAGAQAPGSAGHHRRHRRGSGRAPGRDRPSSLAARGTDGEAVRLRRAEAQVWAVLVDRLHARVRSLEGAEEVAAGSPAAGPSAAAGSPIAAREWLVPWRRTSSIRMPRPMPSWTS